MWLICMADRIVDGWSIMSRAGETVEENARVEARMWYQDGVSTCYVFLVSCCSVIYSTCWNLEEYVRKVRYAPFALDILRYTRHDFVALPVVRLQHPLTLAIRITPSYQSLHVPLLYVLFAFSFEPVVRSRTHEDASRIMAAATFLGTRHLTVAHEQG